MLTLTLLVSCAAGWIEIKAIWIGLCLFGSAACSDGLNMVLGWKFLSWAATTAPKESDSG